MKNIKILGTGCKTCETTLNLFRIAAEQAGVEIELEKVPIPSKSWAME